MHVLSCASQLKMLLDKSEGWTFRRKSPFFDLWKDTKPNPRFFIESLPDYHVCLRDLCHLPRSELPWPWPWSWSCYPLWPWPKTEFVRELLVVKIFGWQGKEAFYSNQVILSHSNELLICTQFLNANKEHDLLSGTHLLGFKRNSEKKVFGISEFLIQSSSFWLRIILAHTIIGA